MPAQATTDTVTMKGNPLSLAGAKLSVGDAAPDCTLITNDLSEATISSYQGKKVILSVVPSLDTGVCDTQTRRFNEEAAKLGDDVAILTVSMDLPFAQARWCGAAGVERVETLSDYQTASFGEAYGVLVQGLRLLARAIFVLDSSGTIQYIQIVDEITTEPDYEAALNALNNL